MGKGKKPVDKDTKKSSDLGPWKQWRSRPAEWTKLERRGDCIVLAGPSNHTATEMRADYELLYWDVRKLTQWRDQKREKGVPATIEEAKKDFRGTTLVGDDDRVPLLTESELQELVDRNVTPSIFAENIVSKRWGMTINTGRTYLRRKSSQKKTRRKS